jgi:beta-alanine--pyruvate transaminase
LCDQYGLLLIFDEVITGFGRLGTPFAAQYFDVKPDMMTLAKGLTNATVPMGAVVCHDDIYQTVVQATPVGGIELFHGYTYSGHPLAAAAACATIDVYRQEALFTRANRLAVHFENAMHSLKGHPYVRDIRNLGLVGGIDLTPRPNAPGARAYEVFLKCYEAGVLIRYTGDILAFSPPLIISEAEISHLFETVGRALKQVA